MIDDRWARHGIAAERAREWQAQGFGVLDAAAWSRHKIAPVDARAWERAGFYGGDLPSRAALWHHGGFTPQQAIGWGALPDRSPGGWVFPPSIAVSFRDAGFTPARAWPWWRRGFTARRPRSGVTPGFRRGRGAVGQRRVRGPGHGGAVDRGGCDAGGGGTVHADVP